MAKAKEIIGLDCSAPALEGAAKVLRTRLDEFIELYRASSDFSGLDLIHDLRVASRRLRSALRDFAPLLNKESFKEIKKDWKEVADALGQVRDQDVAIEALKMLQTETESESLKEQLGLLIEEYKAGRRTAQAELAAILTGERIAELREAFSAKLDAALD
jgi:CHAD domain-containing protein